MINISALGSHVGIVALAHYLIYKKRRSIYYFLDQFFVDVFTGQLTFNWSVNKKVDRNLICFEPVVNNYSIEADSSLHTRVLAYTLLKGSLLLFQLNVY